MKKWFYALTGLFIAIFFTHSAYGSSSEMEVLLKILEKKGIITSSEAQSIAKETKEIAAKEAAKAKEEAATKQTLAKNDEAKKEWETPDWLKNTKFKGDLRLRGEVSDRLENNTKGTRERLRYRLRVGAETAITDQVTVGFGLGSGEYASTLAGANGNARSGNQTLSDSFTRKPVWIDTAYVTYKPAKWFSIMGGKFNNPVWQPSDFFLCSEVNPEGAAIKLSGTVSPYVDLFFDGAFYLLSERTTDPDAIMYVAQPGIKLNFTKDTSLRLTAGYYGFDNVARFTPFTGTTATNTLNSKGNYLYEYNAYTFGTELGFKNPFGSKMIPYFAILGGYITNSDPRRDNKAYLAGFNIGYPSIVNFADWNLEYTFRRYERDSVLDIFPDTSFYGGATNAMGHRIKAAFGLTKNISLGLNYYNTWTVRPVPAAANRNGNQSVENLGQLDFLFKF
ncbi:MAG: putative porin [Proteobacteria bacterium]|nr:putative porin [Pseudomonadota bacterium]